MQLSSDDMIELRAGDYVAKLAPAAGARIAALVRVVNGVAQPLLVEWDGHAFDEHAWPKAGAFPMLPFANRLPREGFRFEGHLVRPTPGPAGFALHGLAHRRHWDVVETTRTRALMRCLHDGSDPGWPWAWSAEQQVELGEGGMTVTVRVKNEGAERMPLTIGWHPYHPAPTPMAADLQFDAAARHDLDEEGRAQVLATPPSFGMQPGETAALARWHGRLALRLHGVGSIQVASNAGNGLVLHRPPKGDYICAEPVTSLPGCMESLAVGARRQLHWHCRLEPVSTHDIRSSAKTPFGGQTALDFPTTSPTGRPATWSPSP